MEVNYYGVHNEGDTREEIQICWKNITNHTTVQFVVESSNLNDLRNSLLVPFVNHEFLISYDFVLAGKVNILSMWCL